MDGFAGAGIHLARDSGALIWGSPANALLINPPFAEYHFIDLDQGNVDTLRELVGSRATGPYDPSQVFFYNADCNEVLLSEVFPRSRYEDYRRALCLLDPYGLDLDWQVLYAAGQMKSVEIFLNFPIADMNRNVLLRDQAKVSDLQLERMRRFWGDESWKEAAYTTEGDLFGFEEKTTNEAMVSAFQERLRTVAGFSYVADPIPMRNKKRATIYYLFFASQKPVAAQIVQDIFDKYRNKGA
jgi:three-Cys-motif partner protein